MAGDHLRLVHFYGDKDENGYPHGLGLAVMEADSAYKSEAVCAGEWSHGRRHGRCMVSRPESFRYLGDFVDDVFDGDGLLADFEEESRLYGKFRGGEFVAGRVIKTKVMFEGQLGPDKKLTGQGFRQNINGLLTVGGFKNGKNHGVVFMRWQDETKGGLTNQEVKQQPGRFIGILNEGQFIEGAFFKEGEGSVYMGTWDRSPRRSGLGVEFCVDGGIYEGEWSDDRRHGMGTLYSADGNSIVYGRFEADILVTEHHRWTWTASKVASSSIEPSLFSGLTLAWKTSCLEFLRQGALSEPWKRREELKALRIALDKLKLEMLELECKYPKPARDPITKEPLPWLERGKITDREDAWVLPERYDGEVNESGLRHGMGTLYYSNGDIYMGQWQEGCRHGMGTQIYVWSLDKYEGEWAGDQWNGLGRQSRVDGSVLEASYKDGRLHGASKLTTPEGVTVESAWVDGKVFTGDVRIVWPRAPDDLEGLRFRGMVEEVGPFQVPRRNSGIQWYPDGTIYWGEFDTEGYRCSAKGFQINADGSVLEGPWVTDKPEGLTTIYKRMDRKQELMEIKFSQGIPNGTGMLCRVTCNTILTVKYDWGKKVDEMQTERRQEERAIRIRKLIETKYTRAIKVFAQQKESIIRDVAQGEQVEEENKQLRPKLQTGWGLKKPAAGGTKCKVLVPFNAPEVPIGSTDANTERRAAAAGSTPPKNAWANGQSHLLFKKAGDGMQSPPTAVRSSTASLSPDTDDDEGDVEHHCHIRGSAVIPPLQIPESSKLMGNGNGGSPAPMRLQPAAPRPSAPPVNDENEDALMLQYQRQFGDGSISRKSDESFEVVAKGKPKKGGGNISIRARVEPGWCSAAIHFEVRPPTTIVNRYLVQAFPIFSPTKVKRFSAASSPVICSKLQNNVKYSFRCGIIEGSKGFTKFMDGVIRTTPPGAEKVPPPRSQLKRVLAGEELNGAFNRKLEVRHPGFFRAVVKPGDCSVVVHFSTSTLEVKKYITWYWMAEHGEKEGQVRSSSEARLVVEGLMNGVEYCFRFGIKTKGGGLHQPEGAVISATPGVLPFDASPLLNSMSPSASMYEASHEEEEGHQEEEEEESNTLDDERWRQADEILYRAGESDRPPAHSRGLGLVAIEEEGEDQEEGDGAPSEEMKRMTPTVMQPAGTTPSFFIKAPTPPSAFPGQSGGIIRPPPGLQRESKPAIASPDMAASIGPPSPLVLPTPCLGASADTIHPPPGFGSAIQSPSPLSVTKELNSQDYEAVLKQAWGLDLSPHHRPFEFNRQPLAGSQQGTPAFPSLGNTGTDPVVKPAETPTPPPPPPPPEETSRLAELEDALAFAPALQGLERWTIQQMAAYYSWGSFPRQSQDNTFEQREVTIRASQGQPQKQRLVRKYGNSDNFIKDLHAFNALAGRPHPNLVTLDSWACDPHIKFSYLLLSTKLTNLALWLNTHTPDNPAYVLPKERDLAVRMRAAHCLASAVVHLYDNGLRPRDLSAETILCDDNLFEVLLTDFTMVEDEKQQQQTNSPQVQQQPSEPAGQTGKASNNTSSSGQRVNEWRGNRGPDPRPLGLLLLHLLSGKAPRDDISSPPVEGGHLSELACMRDLLLSCLAPSAGVRPALREVLNTLGMRRLDACPSVAISSTTREKDGKWEVGKSLDFFAGPKFVGEVIDILRGVKDRQYDGWPIRVVMNLEQKVKNDYLRVLGAAAAGSFDTIENLVQTFLTHVRDAGVLMMETLPTSPPRMMRPPVVPPPHPAQAYYDYGHGQAMRQGYPPMMPPMMIVGPPPPPPPPPPRSVPQQPPTPDPRREKVERLLSVCDKYMEATGQQQQQQQQEEGRSTNLAVMVKEVLETLRATVNELATYNPPPPQPAYDYGHSQRGGGSWGR